MSKIQVNDLNNSGADLFEDSESYMNDLERDSLGAVGAGLMLSPAPSLGPSIIVITRTSIPTLTNPTLTNSTVITKTSISPVTL
ncbi:hypothetical protein [Lyngbya confervoides]|uniref:Uncharacterized protein n=1 Tax=Lyngbya confervoides BDU141951 TaxID=1574623 RepID=A0ABD4T4U5_9CYAN|nr:hypothetical protein [Lyngbya confervoides]MCM1983600.1 hypothetical protein [Lyngbya confervoides BDU141951]